MEGQPAMDLTFTKRAGKYDELVITREGRVDETIACPKQGIIPHDMVHYAVEHTLYSGGFLSLVSRGADTSYVMAGGDAEEAIERLVETFQAELWGGRVDAADLIATYEHACAAREHAAVPITAAQIVEVREVLDSLSTRWAATDVNDSLRLSF